MRPVLQAPCAAILKAQGEGPLQLKYSSEPNTATHIVNRVACCIYGISDELLKDEAILGIALSIGWVP